MVAYHASLSGDSTLAELGKSLISRGMRVLSIAEPPEDISAIVSNSPVSPNSIGDGPGDLREKCGRPRPIADNWQPSSIAGMRAERPQKPLSASTRSHYDIESPQGPVRVDCTNLPTDPLLRNLQSSTSPIPVQRHLQARNCRLHETAWSQRVSPGKTSSRCPDRERICDGPKKAILLRTYDDATSVLMPRGSMPAHGVLIQNTIRPANHTS